MDELIASGLMRFTDLDRENGTLDLDKCGDEIPSAWRKRRSAEARKKAERSAREAAAKKAKAEREEKERQRLAARREAEAKRRADAAAVKARRSSGAAAAASAKRRRGDAGASMLMAAVDFVESARREDVHSDDESRPPKTKRGRSNERSNATRSTEISEEEEAAAAVESLEAAAAVESLGGVTPSPPRDREDSVEGGGGDEVTPPSGGEKMAPPTGHPPTSAGYVPPRKTSLSSTAVHVLGSIARRVGGSFGGGGGAGGGAGGVAPTPRDPATPRPPTAATPSNEDGDEDSGATATEEVAPTAVTAATGRMILGASSEDDRRRVVAVDVSPAVATTSRRVTFHEASEVFRGGSSTTWMIRLLASWMSPTDAATRATDTSRRSPRWRRKIRLRRTSGARRRIRRRVVVANVGILRFGARTTQRRGGQGGTRGGGGREGARGGTLARTRRGFGDGRRRVDPRETNVDAPIGIVALPRPRTGNRGRDRRGV